MRCLELETIPGLLQTEPYMRKLHARLSPKEVDKRVRTRLHRQSRLAGDDPLQMTAVISQAALERCAREASVAAGQDGPFTLPSSPDGLLPDAVHQEYAVGGHLIDTPEVVSTLATLFSELRRKSLDPSESLAMIGQLAETQPACEERHQ